MYTFKHKLVSPLVLISIDYAEDAEAIIPGVDASLIEWRAILM